MQKDHVLELKNGRTYWVSANQALEIDKSWAAFKPIMLEGERFGADQIKGIWPLAAWYEMHPESRPKAEPQVELPAPSKTQDTDLWWEATNRNRELLKTKQKPRWSVEDHKLIEKDLLAGDVIGERPCKNHTYPIHRGYEHSVKATWVKKTVSPAVYSRQYSAPGYHLLGNEYENVVVVFMVVGEIPNTVEVCSPNEVDRIERKLAV